MLNLILKYVHGSIEISRQHHCCSVCPATAFFAMTSCLPLLDPTIFVPGRAIKRKLGEVVGSAVKCKRQAKLDCLLQTPARRKIKVIAATPTVGYLDCW